MLQSLKAKPRWLTQLALAPQSAMAAARFHLQAWTALPERAPHAHVVKGISQEDDTFRQLSFTFAVIALSARVSTADGPLTKDKYIAFRESFPLNRELCGKIRALFMLACKNDAPVEHYIHQIKYMYPGKEELFTSVVERLFRIAAAEGHISRKAEFLLADIALGFGMNANSFADIRSLYDRPADAHQVLGVAPHVKAATLKKRYHELMRRYHPDRYGAEQLSDEMRLLLRAKTAEINTAYKILARKAA